MFDLALHGQIGAATRDRSAEKGRVADLSVPMMNQVLEATLAFMILLLALSVTAIIRVGPMAPAQTESNTDAEMEAAGPATMAAAPASVMAGPASMLAGPQPGRAVQAAPPAVWAPVPGSVRPGATAPDARRPGLLGRRYEARHVRGRIPKPRPAAPAGPPWGPATPPPGRPQQGSERWN
jgi:hypothetical protein